MLPPYGTHPPASFGRFFIRIFVLVAGASILAALLFNSCSMRDAAKNAVDTAHSNVNNATSNNRTPAPNVRITNARVRNPPDGAEHTAGYLSFTNNGRETITLVSAESSFSDYTELHTTEITGGMTTMKQIFSVTIKSNQTLEFKPRNMHVMFINIDRHKIKKTLKIKFITAQEKIIEFEAKLMTSNLHSKP